MINMEQRDIAVLSERIEHIDERITELGGNFQAIQKSYYILNEHHHKLEINVATLRAELGTVRAIIQWVISPTVLIGFLIQLARIGGVI